MLKLAIGVSAAFGLYATSAYAFGQKLPSGTTTTTQQAAEAKKREGQTGTSNENASRQLKEVNRELNQQSGKKK